MVPAYSRPICPKWGNTLVGLRISVSDYWCPEYSGQNLHQSMISAFLEDKNLWLLKLDDVNDNKLYTLPWYVI